MIIVIISRREHPPTCVHARTPTHTRTLGGVRSSGNNHNNHAEHSRGWPTRRLACGGVSSGVSPEPVIICDYCDYWRARLGGLNIPKTQITPPQSRGGRLLTCHWYCSRSKMVSATTPPSTQTGLGLVPPSLFRTPEDTHSGYTVRSCRSCARMAE